MDPTPESTSNSLTQLVNEKRRKLFSKQFLLWLVLLSITMFFAALTSAYLVKSGDGGFLKFRLPSMFSYTTILVLLSSASMQGAYLCAKRNSLRWLKGLLFLTLLLGLGFLWGQLGGWRQLIIKNIYFIGNPGGSFVYVISGTHAIHLLAGILYLLYILYRTWRYQVHSENLLGLKMCLTYWHFISLLWLYLYIFFSFVP